MSRTRAERRHNNVNKAIRKERIVKEVYSENFDGWYDNLHQYSKNKIHCSCPLCSCKTRSKNSLGKSYYPPISQQRRIDEMDYELKNFQFGDV